MDQRINRSEKKKSLSVASVLSDLTSLGACEYANALALVSARPVSGEQENKEHAGPRQTDPDLRRAFTLLEVYQSVKRDFQADTQLKGRTSDTPRPSSAQIELQDSRRAVSQAIETLE